MSKALVLAGQLKPEVRLGQSLSEFAQALDDKHRRRFTNLRANSMTTPTAADVIKVTEELNREGAKRHRVWRPFSTRLVAFLSRIQAFASIGDVIVGGSQNLIASGVWCAIRLCLESAIGFLSYYDKISSLFMKLATAWSLYNDFAKLFTESRELQSFSLEYIIGTVRLCEKIVLFTRKSTLAQFASSMLSSFDNEFNPLLTEIDQWGKLIEQKSNILSARFTFKAETNAIERNTSIIRHITGDSKRQRRFDHKYRLLLSLSPHQGVYEALWRRQRRKGTCRWIFETSEYKSWRSRDTSCMLWLDGSMGSGKTVTLANIVADIHLHQPCLYFFCVSKEPSSLSCRGFLGSLAYQLLRNLPTEDPFWSSFNPDEAVTNPTTYEGIADLLLRAMSNDERYFLVVDGVENCSNDEADAIITFLSDLMKKKTVLLCSSGTPRSKAQTILSSDIDEQSKIYVTLNNQSRYKEIEDFIICEVERRTTSRPLTSKLKDLITTQLTSGAQGMYLWAALQLEAVLPMNSDTVVSTADICNILQNLPRDLPEAYDQALARVKDQRYGNNHFKIVAASKYPLSLDELQVAVTVVPGNTTWNAAALPLDPAVVVYVCGGNLLEIDEEDGRVHFIHHSALLHLLSVSDQRPATPFHFSPEDAELHIGSVCVTYLNYNIFDTRVATQQRLYASNITDKVVDVVTETKPILNQLMGYVVRHHRRKNSFDMDFLHQILDAKDQKPQVVLSFLPYASSNWLEHTHTLSNDTNTWNYWMNLMTGKLSHVQLPWAAQDYRTSSLEWATLHSHGPLFNYSLLYEKTRQTDIEMVIRLTKGDPKAVDIEPELWSDIIARCITMGIYDWDTIKYFLDAGASPFKEHGASSLEPVKLLFSDLCVKGSKLQNFLTQFLDHPAVWYDFDQQRHWKTDDWASLLIDAIRLRWTDVSIRLINLGIEVNRHPPRDSPLGAAVHFANQDVTKKLIRVGVSPSMSYFNNKPAILVAFEGWKAARGIPDERQRIQNIAQLLLVTEPRVFDTFNTFLCSSKGAPFLSSNHDKGTMHFAFFAGENPDALSSDGRTQLHIWLEQLQESGAIIEYNRAEVHRYISILINQCGANPNIRCHKGVSPVEIALRFGYNSILRMMLNKGGDANGLTSTGTTFLHLAAILDNVEAFELLVEQGASIDQKDSSGLTALDRAGADIKKWKRRLITTSWLMD